MGSGSESARGLRDRIQRLAGVKQRLAEERGRVVAQQLVLQGRLGVAAEVERTLEQVSDQLFGQVVKLLQEKLSIALQEVLGQPLQLGIDCEPLRGAAAMRFYIERDGKREDIMRGQGGSVLNVLSVGLRMFALTTLDAERHRRFLVLDEQDCWLRPDLVPRLARIMCEASSALGFQVLMISHHDIRAFERYADRVYRLEPVAQALDGDDGLAHSVRATLCHSHDQRSQTTRGERR
jgi:hypothetical protein